MYDRTRVFAQILTKEEHEILLKNLVAERKLRKRIEQLQHYRRLGIHTMKEAEEYESEKKKRVTPNILSDMIILNEIPFFF